MFVGGDRGCASHPAPPPIPDHRVTLFLIVYYEHPSIYRETQARVGTSRDRASPHGLPSGKGGYDENGAFITEQQVRALEAEENVAYQKAADKLVKPLKGAGLWGQGQVAVEWDGKCPICKKVGLVLVLVAVLVLVKGVGVGSMLR